MRGSLHDESHKHLAYQLGTKHNILHLINNDKQVTAMTRFPQLLLCFIFGLIHTAAHAQIIFDKHYTGVQKEQFADGKPKFEVTVVNGLKQGYERFWYANGQLHIQTQYVDDKEDGVWNQWYENGQLKLEAHYKQGREHGSFIQWYETGQMRTQSQFVDGKKEGTETAWNLDGSLKYQHIYVDGKLVSY